MDSNIPVLPETIHYNKQINIKKITKMCLSIENALSFLNSFNKKRPAKTPRDCLTDNDEPEPLVNPGALNPFSKSKLLNCSTTVANHILYSMLNKE